MVVECYKNGIASLLFLAKRDYCPIPEISNGSIQTIQPNSNWPIGSTLNYKCDDGYERTGGNGNTIMCVAMDNQTGKWNESFCTGKTLYSYVYDYNHIIVRFQGTCSL